MKAATEGRHILRSECPGVARTGWRGDHPLLGYVGRPDREYRWRPVARAGLRTGGLAVRLHLVSQVWQGIPWKHALTLVFPPRAPLGSTMLLLVAGSASLETQRLIVRAAHALGTPAGVLCGIPNQPLLGGRSEDALIAHTFVRCLETRDDTWPLLFPMAKAVVRAMDAVQEFTRQEWGVPVQRFVVTGASKRGWTTWLAGAADRRVAGIAPLVYDNLNLPAQMAAQLAAYGAYSSEVRDYTDVGLPQRLAAPEGRRLAALVDPHALRDRLALPKLIVNATNDRYWTLESANLYFGDLPGEKHLLYVPNSGHSLDGLATVLPTLGAFIQACAAGAHLPQLTWSLQEMPDALVLTIRPGAAPRRVGVWTATAPTRDFRGASWRRQEVRVRNGRYAFTLARPRNGYQAAIGEVTYAGDTGTFRLSTTPAVLGPR